MALFYVIAVHGPSASSDAGVNTVPIAATKVLSGPPSAGQVQGVTAGLKNAKIVEIEAASAAKAKEAYQVVYGTGQIALIAGETSNVT